MIELARTENEVAILPTDLDTDSWLLNVENGTIDLRTGRLREHRRGDLITKLAPVTFDLEARCPTWLRFLDTIMAGDPALIAFIQRLIGYSLTGSTSEQCLMMLWGAGANGKSTFISTIATMLGDYAVSAQADTFLVRHGDGARGDLARLKGARFVSAVEAEEGRRLAESLVKQLTGGDSVTARFLYQNEFEFTMQAKLWFALNHKPVIRGTDHAIWRRLRLIPFTVTIPDHEQDRNLPEKLRAELPGILRWAVEGCIAWHRDGLGASEAVARAVGEYRQESDPLAAFIEDCCVSEPEAREKAARLWDAYTRWCAEAREPALKQKQFWASLTERGFESEKKKAGNYRKGIRLMENERGGGWRQVEVGSGTSHVERDMERVTETSSTILHPPPLSCGGRGGDRD